MKDNDIEILEKSGWIVECQSPFEIRHEDGSFATLNAAEIVLDEVRREHEALTNSIKALEELNAIDLQPLYTEAMFEVNNEYDKLFKNQQRILQAIKIVGNNTIFYDKEDE